MNDALGDRVKAYEMEVAGRKLLPLIPAMARLDGRSFSKFTKDMNRPYDERFAMSMIRLTKYLVKETNACMGYTQSDEITLTWYSDNSKSEIFFNGRIQKMESVLAGMASVLFFCELPFYFDRGVSALQEKLPHFDARVWNVPTLEEGANCFLWREWDATKNSISMAAQSVYSHKELHNKHTGEMLDMLMERKINWNNYPTFFKRGTYIQRNLLVSSQRKS
jgi:tRNA(His) guanylyltransferase